MTTPLEKIKYAAAGRWVEVLVRFGLPRDLLDGKNHPCPKCGGTDRFRYRDTGGNGVAACNQCSGDKVGDGIDSVCWWLDKKYKEVIPKLLHYLGIEDQSNGQRVASREEIAQKAALKLKKIDWNPQVAENWAAKKSPISAESIIAAGGYLAKYNHRETVIALPIYGGIYGSTKEQNITGHVLLRADGEPFQLYNNKTKKFDRSAKVKMTAGSVSGLLGKAAIDQIQSAEVVIKVEGATCLLSLMSAIPPELRGKHVVISNSAGTENPKEHQLEIFTGKIVYVISDCDAAGRKHARKWAEAIAQIASEVRLVKLPFDVESKKDVRDYLADGNSYQSLLALAENSPCMTEDDYEIREEDDDPHRLAKVFLEQYCEAAKHGNTLSYYRQEFYRWNGTRYYIVENQEMRANVNLVIKKEFNKIWIRGDQKRSVQKVTRSIVTNVISAIESLTILSSDIDQPCWIDGGQNIKKRIISFKNGLLDVDKLFDNQDGAFFQHSPKWFSIISLPYNYDPKADCPLWLSTLDTNLEKDQERCDILQEWSGYCLFPTTDHQKFLVIEGDGSNGKSVYCAGLTALVGDQNVSHVGLEQFNRPFVLAATIGKLANIVGDTGEIDKAAEGILKAFTSGDRMTFDRKNISAIQAIPTARILISINVRPRFSDRSSGIWRRMILVPFNREIQDHEKIHGMDKSDFWSNCDELSGMFNWALDGLRRLREKHKFTDSKVCKAAQDEYKTDMNPAKEFLMDNCSEIENGKVYCQKIYDAYSSWCLSVGRHPIGSREFGKEVKRAFTATERVRLGPTNNRYYLYQGIESSIESVNNMF